jgi:putative transcriptional regulator
MDAWAIRRELRERVRRARHPPNPLGDPIAHIKRPMQTVPREEIEFTPFDVKHVRAKFAATQKQFARLIGVSPETLRNWETGRRRPHGPARALLRAIDADPVALARALNWYARECQEEPVEWLDA